MRRPSGDLQMKSVTNRTAVPSKANRNGQEPLSRCSATSSWSALASNSACTVPLGQTIRATSDLRLIPQAEMDDRPGDHLLLDEQAGPDLDLPAQAERVDPAVAERPCAPGPDDLPVVVLGPPPDVPRAGRPSRRQPHQVEPAVGVQVGDGEDTQARRRGQRAEAALAVGQLDPCRPSDPRADQVGAPLLSRSATRRRAAFPTGRRRPDKLDHVPGMAVVPVRDPKNGPVGSHRQQVDRPRRYSRRRPPARRARRVRPGRAAAGTGPRVRSCRSAGRPGRPASAASGSPSPSRSAQAKSRRSVAPSKGSRVPNVPSPLLRSTDTFPCPGPEHQIEVAVHLDVRRPDAEGIGGQNGRIELGGRGHVGKRAVFLLLERPSSRRRRRRRGPSGSRSSSPRARIPCERGR